MRSSKKIESVVQDKVEKAFYGSTHSRPDHVPVTDERRARAAAIARSVVNGAATASIYRDAQGSYDGPDM